MGQVFELIMLICFGLSWPTSVLKSYRSRTAKGKSLFFEIFIWVGYVVGVIGKFVSHNITYVLIIYAINIIMVSIDICLYFRNTKLDKLAEAQKN
ncbi:MAG: hypothetical protein IJ106_09385 [Parasporobacterium sp.]|nr:hypothetical protein [Parasporobacterium sp.]